jgi:glycosyltransferase involved in cell wall biosynthesis
MTRVVMLLENQPYPADVRVRAEATSLRAAGHAVRVIAPRAAGEPARDLVDGVVVERYRLPAENSGAAGLLVEFVVAMAQLHWRGARALLQGAHVLHLHNPPDLLWPLALLFRKLGRRVVYDQHDLVPELTELRFGSRPLVASARLAERLTFRAADVVLVPNASQREAALTRGRVAPGRVVEVRNGPPRATLAAPAAGRRGRLEDVRVLFLGSMAPQDGVDALPDLLERLREAHGLPRARMMLIGDGPARAPLEQAFARRGLAAAADFVGRVHHDDVPAALARADICVDPAGGTTLNHRSTMVKVAEYLAAGRPVVAYDLVETRRTAAGAALLVPPDDREAFAAAVARLAGTPGEREALAHRARERAEALVWEHSERNLLAAYADLVAAPRRRAAGRAAVAVGER